MKTTGLIVIVVALHCAAIGALFFIQGCGTTKHTGTPPPPAPVMPPTTEAVKTPYTPPPPPPPEIKPVEKPSAPTPVKEVKPATPAPIQGTVEYVVKAGDSIGAIAKKHGVTKAQIMDANKIKDPNKIKVGQKLTIPKAVAAPGVAHKPAEKAAPAGKHAATPVAAKPGEYIVQAGDSLSKIAAKHGVKASALRDANKLKSDKLHVGQKLTIPQAAAPALAESKPVESKPAESKPVESKPAAEAAPAPALAPAAGAAPVAPAAPTPAAASAPAPAGSVTHLVQPGEDLNSIAKLYAVTTDELAELNQMGANRTVTAGQRLKIP